MAKKAGKKEEYDNTNRLSLFKNEEREGNQPHFRGSLDVEGTKYNVSIWKVDTESDNVPCGYFLSGSIEEYDKSKAGKSGKKKGKKGEEEEDDLPF